jgi:hypothetical protein
MLKLSLKKHEVYLQQLQYLFLSSVIQKVNDCRVSEKNDYFVHSLKPGHIAFAEPTKKSTWLPLRRFLLCNYPKISPVRKM